MRYIASNNDLITGIGLNAAAATQHWVSTGFAQGRSATSFDALQYVADADLIGWLGFNTTLATQNYIGAGFNEGRSRDSFDEFRYIASNNDLITGIGLNGALATQH